MDLLHEFCHDGGVRVIFLLGFKGIDGADHDADAFEVVLAVFGVYKFAFAQQIIYLVVALAQETQGDGFFCLRLAHPVLFFGPGVEGFAVDADECADLVLRQFGGAVEFFCELLCFHI